MRWYCPSVVIFCRLLDDVATGGGDTQGHGMVLALHLMTQLKSSRKFLQLLTKQYDFICSRLHCLQSFHEQLHVSVCIMKGYSVYASIVPIRTLHISLQGHLEPKPHLLPFMLHGAESTELGALYLRVRKVMVGMHEGMEKMESLLQIAEEW